MFLQTIISLSPPPAGIRQHSWVRTHKSMSLSNFPDKNTYIFFEMTKCPFPDKSLIPIQEKPV